MLSALNALRFFAIVMMYFHHLDYPVGIGAFPVTFFFALSGFVIAYNYDRKFDTLDRKSICHFLIKRISKIYPLHLLTFVFSLPILYVLNMRLFNGYAVLNIFLLHSYYPIGPSIFSYNPLSWFISDMMFFYLLTPLIFFLLQKYPIFRNAKTLRFVILLVFGCETGIVMQFKVEPYSVSWWFVYISPYMRIFDYLIGMLLGVYFVLVRNDIDNGPKNRIVSTLLEAAALFSVFLSIYYAWRIPYPSLLWSVYFIPCSAFVIIVFSRQQGILSDILSRKVFVELGNVSFTIYLIHQLAIYYTKFYFLSPIYGMTWEFKHLSSQILLLSVIVCLADTLNRYFVEPVRKRIAAWSMQR